MAVGESDPTYPGLLEALKQARSQAQVRPVQDSGVSPRAVAGVHQDVEKAGVALRRPS